MRQLVMLFHSRSSDTDVWGTMSKRGCPSVGTVYRLISRSTFEPWPRKCQTGNLRWSHDS